jgi:SPP1 family predicted phage head-tail adaptor
MSLTTSPSPAGLRRILVVLQNPGTSVPDGDGGFTQTWSDLSPRTMWASIAPATARDLERVAAGTVLSSATHIVTMPYHAQVTTKTRITFNGRTLNVTGVSNPDERNRELILACTELVS